MQTTDQLMVAVAVPALLQLLKNINNLVQEDKDIQEQILQREEELKAVEKKLDELMKQESATKRRMGGNNNSGGFSKSGKDW